MATGRGRGRYHPGNGKRHSRRPPHRADNPGTVVGGAHGNEFAVLLPMHSGEPTYRLGPASGFVLGPTIGLGGRQAPPLGFVADHAGLTLVNHVSVLLPPIAGLPAPRLPEYRPNQRDRGAALDRQSLTVRDGLPTLSDEVWALAADVVGYRRHAHRFPEVSFEELGTRAWLQQTLTGLGVKDVRTMAATGLRAVVRGGRPGRTVLWRADIDALPIVEEVVAPYTSAHAGVMHACGHDSHIAVALGLAQWFQRQSDVLAGNVVFAFQPAEEVGGGARPMIEEGVLDDPDVEEVYGFHADSSLRAGTVAASPGHFMASPGSFELVIRGSGGHAGLPHRSVDPIVCAAHVITALQTIVSRNVHPDQAAVLSIGQIHAGTRGNIIPDEVHISGTVRAFDAETFRLIEGRMHTIIKGVTDAFDARYQLTYREGLPAVVNDRRATELVSTIAADVLGAAAVLPDRTTMSDDFALFLQARPGCYFLLGVGNEAWGITHPNHSPRWDLDERALLVGIEVGRQTLMRALAR